MLLWWKEYIHEWKINLFIIVQMVFVLFFVNGTVSSLVEEWRGLNCVEKTEDNLYFYWNALATIGGNAGDWERFHYAEGKLAELNGMEGVVYAAQMWCEVEGYENGVTSDNGAANYNMTPLLWKGIQYPLKEGSWFQEKDAEDDTFQVIIGGGLSKKYHVGDTLTLDYDGGIRKEALVIGDLGTDFYMLDNGSVYNAAGGYIDAYVYQCTEEKNILLSNDTEWFKEFHEQAVYPSSSTMLRIKEGADLAGYEEYGVLTSFDEIMGNTRERCNHFVLDAINYNAVWILIIMFGAVGVAYLTAQRRRYVFGIYSLLGMSGNKMIGRLMLQNLLTYVLGAVVACLADPYLSNLLNYEVTTITQADVVTMGILIGVLLVISYLCNLYIKKIEPKEILTQTRE